MNDADDRERPPDPPSVEGPEDVARALDTALGALNVEAELVADATGLQRPEHRCGVRDGALGREGHLRFDPIGVEPLLDLRPLVGSPHRRISIMAGR